VTTATATAPTETVAPAGERRRSYATGWWGVVVMIMTEAMIFGGLISSYFFVRAGSPEWPLGGIEPPELVRISWFTVVLLGSSVPIFWAEAGIRKGNQRRLRLGLLASFILGAAFMVNLVLEFEELHFLPGDNAYASLFYAITGLHGLHVVVGLLMNLVVQIKAGQGKFSAERHLTVEVFSLYWHFVDVVWIAVFSSLYLTAGL
jgi:heme/copper-type cytochrome/quinol oxidase subunit 3